MARALWIAPAMLARGTDPEMGVSQDNLYRRNDFDDRLIPKPSETEEDALAREALTMQQV